MLWAMWRATLLVDYDVSCPVCEAVCPLRPNLRRLTFGVAVLRRLLIRQLTGTPEIRCNPRITYQVVVRGFRENKKDRWRELCFSSAKKSRHLHAKFYVIRIFLITTRTRGRTGSAPRYLIAHYGSGWYMYVHCKTPFRFEPSHVTAPPSPRKQPHGL
jgi:hypothetical protein